MLSCLSHLLSGLCSPWEVQVSSICSSLDWRWQTGWPLGWDWSLFCDRRPFQKSLGRNNLKTSSFANGIKPVTLPHPDWNAKEIFSKELKGNVCLFRQFSWNVCLGLQEPEQEEEEEERWKARTLNGTSTWSQHETLHLVYLYLASPFPLLRLSYILFRPPSIPSSPSFPSLLSFCSFEVLAVCVCVLR